MQGKRNAQQDERTFISIEKKVHFNQRIQRSFSKYGEVNFRFYLIEIVENIDDLDGREQFWIDVVWNNTFNIQSFSGGSSRGRKHSEETKAKIGQANKRRIWTPESKLKLSLSQKEKITSDQTNKQSTY